MRQQITVWVKADEVAVQLHKQKGLGRAQPEGIPTAFFFFHAWDFPNSSYCKLQPKI